MVHFHFRGDIVGAWTQKVPDAPVDKPSQSQMLPQARCILCSLLSLKQMSVILYMKRFVAVEGWGEEWNLNNANVKALLAVMEIKVSIWYKFGIYLQS